MKSPDWHVISICLWKLTVDVSPWTGLSEGRWLSRQTGRQSKHYKWFCVWEDLRCWGAWDLSVGMRLRISHCWSDWCLEERDMERQSTQQSSSKGWEKATDPIINQMNIGTVSNAKYWGKYLRHGLFWAQKLPSSTELNWTKCCHHFCRPEPSLWSHDPPWPCSHDPPWPNSLGTVDDGHVPPVTL